MESVTSSPAVATAVRANDITLFAPLELSKSKWVVTINSPGSEKFSKPIVEGGDGVLSRFRAKAEQRDRVPVKAVVIQEAGLDGFWIHRLLLAEGSRAMGWMRLRLRRPGGIGGSRPMRSMARRCCAR
jgi:transposase